MSLEGFLSALLTISAAAESERLLDEIIDNVHEVEERIRENKYCLTDVIVVLTLFEQSMDRILTVLCKILVLFLEPQVQHLLVFGCEHALCLENSILHGLLNVKRVEELRLRSIRKKLKSLALWHPLQQFAVIRGELSEISV